MNIDIAKTHLWLKRVSNLLGEDFAKELAATYVTYTLPHTESEKQEMIEMKHHQIFTPEFNRSVLTVTKLLGLFLFYTCKVLVSWFEDKVLFSN